MNPLIVNVKRPFNGMVTLRHYQCNQAWKEGRDIEVHCEGKTMTIPREEIPDGKDTGQTHPSKYPGEPPYKLIDYPWNPDQ